ncbi:MAG: flagellar basal body rod protein FlgC [Anaerolineae bacterium]|nr:flagellar basal body rod protein FlgC [Anaerolineae bacterium]
MSGIFSAFRIAASALTAQRLRMDVIANNVANVETTRTEAGGPYQRQQVVFAANQVDTFASRLTTTAQAPTFPLDNAQGETQLAGVRVEIILTDDAPGNRVYDPDHPDADAEGFVAYPNVNLATEMTDMLSATRSYEANVTVFNALKGMALKALDIGRG